MKFYPVGIQTFSELRERNYVYIDKTKYVYRMTHSAAKYLFLSRPRRFGKSLLVSTLHAYFEGHKELFQELAIERLEKEWTPYPVLRFDMSLGKHLDKDALNRYLHYLLYQNEERLDIAHSDAIDPNIRLTNLIMETCRKYNRQVVVLIDEYDAPLLDVMHEEDLPALRNVMRNFYSPLKACEPYLHYVFLTGITKFSQLSIFSELNNIQNISMDEAYAAICGITEEEIRTQMDADLDAFAAKQKTDKAGILNKLKENYDGYHFTWPSPDIYNPYSLFNAFDTGKLDSYWFGSGTPTYLIEMLRKFGMNAIQLGSTMDASKEDFDAPLGIASGAGLLFGATGGVMEAALRTVYEIVAGKAAPSLDFKEVRGVEDLKEATYDINGTVVKVAVVSGLGNARKLMERVRAGEADYHFIEVMSCPGGCVNGGGQPIKSAYVRNNFDIRAERAKAIYATDKAMKLRKSHENPAVKELYAEYLGEPNSHRAHDILHTKYVPRNNY